MREEGKEAGQRMSGREGEREGERWRPFSSSGVLPSFPRAMITRKAVLLAESVLGSVVHSSYTTTFTLWPFCERQRTLPPSTSSSVRGTCIQCGKYGVCTCTWYIVYTYSSSLEKKLPWGLCFELLCFYESVLSLSHV